MDFTAIDFETATSKSTSICSLGICVVENSKIALRKEILIHPVPFEFNEYNIKIHGITPDMVQNAPTFDKYWGMLRPYIDNRLIVAHNASFDVGCLRASLEQFKVPYPTFDYICTVKLSQKAYPELKSHKLNNLCDALGISFSHHRAADDAYACASVLLRIMEDYSLETFSELEECFEIDPGHLYPGFHEPCKKNKKSAKRKAKISVSGISTSPCI